MIELEPCRVCYEDAAYLEEEGGWCVYVQCPICGSHTSFVSFRNEEERKTAEEKSVYLWNMGKVIAERRGE